MSMNTATAFSGHSNRCFQIGSNSGQVHVNILGQPEESPTKPKPSSTVPFRRDPDFVDRDILAEVHEKCWKPASRVALVGLGGVGKSQLAIEYSYRIREQFPQTWIFWVHASNAARFEQGYRMIADRIKLPQRDEPTADILQLVSNWLCDETNGRWIIILDNADDPAVFSDPRRGKLRSHIGDLASGAISLSAFIPQTPNGSILATSRSKDAALSLTGRHHDIIKVEPMDEDRALLLFKNKLLGEFNKSDARDLLLALDYMPLAISQAAAYICQGAPRTTVAKYLKDFHKNDQNRESLLNRDAEDLRRDNEASNSIITTWQMSFEHIRMKRLSAARLLSLMSFFDPQGIPEFLLHCYDDREDSSDIDLGDKDDIYWENDSNLGFEDDVSTLRNYSLITANVKDDRFEMHRLVQFSTRKWLELNGELEKWKKQYVKIISKAFPEGKYENWTTCQILYPHAAAVLAYRPVETKYLIYWSRVLNNAGRYATKQGNYLTAEEMNRRALAEREKALGKEHSDTLMSINNLASVLRRQGKYKLAEDMNRQVLDRREKALGKEHPDTLTSVSNLALVLQCQGKFEAAEKMNRRVLDGREKVLGKEHRETLTSVNNLALVLRHQGKYEAAEEMNQRVLNGWEKALGKEHPDTLTSVGNLASVLFHQEKYEAAENMSQRVLDGRQKALGKEHPDTLASLDALASVLFHQGKYEAAEEMNRKALEGREKALGKEHPHTLTLVSNLAGVLQGQRQYEAAEELNRRALDGREKVLGKEHPDTLTSVGNLASLLFCQRKYEAAEEMSRKALEGREKALGKEHPHTLTLVSNLAGVLQGQRKYEAAEELNRRALDGREKVLGKEHPDTLTSVGNLASLLFCQRKYEAAEEMSRKALEGREKALGKEHPQTLTLVSNLAGVLQGQRKYEAAEELNRRALDGREKTLGKEHPHTLTSVRSLAGVLRDQEKYEAAVEMSQQALNGYEKALGTEHHHTLTSVYCLAYLQHKQKHYRDATKLYRRACAGFRKVFGVNHPTTLACSKHYSSMIKEMRASSHSKDRRRHRESLRRRRRVLAWL